MGLPSTSLSDGTSPGHSFLYQQMEGVMGFLTSSAFSKPQLPRSSSFPLPAGTKCVRKVVSLTPEECDKGLPCIVPTVTRASCPGRPAKRGCISAHNWGSSSTLPHFLWVLVCRSAHSWAQKKWVCDL